MDFLFGNANWPFASALVLLIAIACIEGAGVIAGNSLSDWLDHLIPDSVDSALGWLHVGKVPFLILLVLFLAGFSIFGYTTQAIWHSLMHVYLWTILAVLPALFGGILFVRVFGGVLAKFNVQDETRVVSDDALIGRVGTIIAGQARQGLAAQAKLKDQHGFVHYVLVEPDNPNEVILEGVDVLLVRRVGSRYFVINNPINQLLS